MRSAPTSQFALNTVSRTLATCRSICRTAQQRLTCPSRSRRRPSVLAPAGSSDLQIEIPHVSPKATGARKHRWLFIILVTAVSHERVVCPPSGHDFRIGIRALRVGAFVAKRGVKNYTADSAAVACSANLDLLVAGYIAPTRDRSLGSRFRHQLRSSIEAARSIGQFTKLILPFINLTAH